MESILSVVYEIRWFLGSYAIALFSFGLVFGALFPNQGKDASSDADLYLANKNTVSAGGVLDLARRGGVSTPQKKYSSPSLSLDSRWIVDVHFKIKNAFH